MLAFHIDRCCRDARHAPGPRTAEGAELRPADGGALSAEHGHAGGTAGRRGLRGDPGGHS